MAGGGTVALRKIEKLVPYGPRLTVAAAEVRKEILQTEGVTVLREPFQEYMLEGKYFVIAATDDREMNHRISRLCRERGLLVNVVDDRQACSFIFPSLVKRGKLSVGISTEGASPSAAIHIKEHLNQWIPESFDEILDFLEKCRPQVKKRISCERERAACFTALFTRCMEAGRPLTEEEFKSMLDEKVHKEKKDSR